MVKRSAPTSTRFGSEKSSTGCTYVERGFGPSPHERADEQPERRGEQQHCVHQQRGEKAAAEVFGGAEAGGEEERIHARGVTAQRGVGEERGRHERAEETAEERGDLRDAKRRVAGDRVAAAVVDVDDVEGEEKQQAAVEPGRGGPQPVAELVAESLGESHAAARAPACPPITAKYTSLRSGSTG